MRLTRVILKNAAGGVEFHIKADALQIIKIKWDLIIAFPPCTHLCSSGQRWFCPDKNGKVWKDPELRDEAVEFFMKFANANCPRIAIENPIGIMSTRYRKPDQIINPYEFGHTDCKSTCLWLKGLPKLKPTNIIPEEQRTHSVHLGKYNGKYYRYNDPELAVLRSRTYHGIAVAMAEQWGSIT